MPCARTRSLALALCALFSHHASARPPRTTRSRSALSNAFCGSRRISSAMTAAMKRPRTSLEPRMPEVVSPPKGTRPEGAHSEAGVGRRVREMFTQIAPRYDLLNHLLSLELDRLWRARAVAQLKPLFAHSAVSMLDLCCGTGDLAIAFASRYVARVTGVDFAHTMLLRAQKKGTSLHGKNRVQLRPIRFVEADALRLPFPNSSFDLVTSAFGFRNLANYEDGFNEIRRVLKPGGTVAILEFTEAPPGLLGNLYRWYCRKLLPRIGG